MIQLSFVLCIILTFFSSAFAADKAQNKAESELNKTEQQLKSLRQNIGKNQKLSSNESTLVRQQSNRIKKLEKTMRSMEKKIAKGSDKLKEYERKLVILRRNVTQQKLILSKQINAAYRMGQQSGVKLLLSQKNPQDFIQISAYYHYFAAARRSKINDTLYDINQLADTRLKTAKSRKSYLATIDKLRKKRKTHSNEKQKHKRLLASLKSKLNDDKRQIDVLNINKNRLKTLINKLALQAVTAKKGLASNKGQIPWPVNGAIEARFGESKPYGKLRWNGMFFAADIGTEVRTVADGEVVYADWLQGFGMLVIIDHGDSYLSLYGSNNELLTDIGQNVSNGQVIATVGDSGGQSNSGLYFEIRYKAQAIDPQKWINPQIRFANSNNFTTQ